MSLKIPLDNGLSAAFAEGYYNPDYFFIDAGNFLNDGGDYIYIPSLVEIGIYTFEQFDFNLEFYSQNLPFVFCKTYDEVDLSKHYYSFENFGTINITRLDTTNTIISGTFQLKVQNKDNPDDTIEITEGRFDINWTTLYN